MGVGRQQGWVGLGGGGEGRCKVTRSRRGKEERKRKKEGRKGGARSGGEVRGREGRREGG